MGALPLDGLALRPLQTMRLANGGGGGREPLVRWAPHILLLLIEVFKATGAA